MKEFFVIEKSSELGETAVRQKKSLLLATIRP